MTRDIPRQRRSSSVMVLLPLPSSGGCHSRSAIPLISNRPIRLTFACRRRWRYMKNTAAPASTRSVFGVTAGASRICRMDSRWRPSAAALARGLYPRRANTLRFAERSLAEPDGLCALHLCRPGYHRHRAQLERRVQVAGAAGRSPAGCHCLGLDARTPGEQVSPAAGRSGQGRRGA